MKTVATRIEKPRKFQQRNWFINVHHYSGLVGAVIGVWWLTAGMVRPWWLVLWFSMHMLIILGASVGYHRLFCHQSFKTSRFWHVVWGIIGTLSGTGSGIGWRVLHLGGHHKHADGPGDPHNTSLTYLLWKRYNDVPLNPRYAAPLLRDPFQVFLHEYYMLIVVVIAALMLAISPTVYVFGFLAPVWTVGFGGGLNNIFSHWGGRPRQLWFMEFIWPLAGEWLHAQHHARDKSKNPAPWDNRTAWYHFDLSARVIGWIKQ